MGFPFADFSLKQKQLINWWADGSPYQDYDGFIADGAIRSGKTIGMIVSYMLWSQGAFSTPQNFILAGKSFGSLKRNVVLPLLNILDTWGWGWQYNRGEGFVVVRGHTYYMFGASTEASQDMLQGLTAAGALADEASLFPQSFIDQMVGRCSVEGSRMFFNCNPRGPLHYFKVEFIDKADEKRLVYTHFDLDDNTTLSEDVKARYRRMFSGMFYRRYILGEWVSAQGAIYDMFDLNTHVIDAYADVGEPADVSRLYGRFHVSCDYGTQNPHVYLLWGERKADKRWVCLKEYYWDGRGTNRQKTDEEYHSDLIEFVGDLAIERVIVDPSAASFIATIRKHGVFRVRKGRNAVLTGIRNTATALTAGMILFDKSCENTIKEFHSYEWDKKAVERGDDVPLKQSDHAMDAVRYMVLTVIANTNMSVLR